MESLLKSLREYFKYLEKHDVVMSDLIKRTLKPLEALKNLSEQRRYVAKAEIQGLPIARVPGIKENLLFKISSVIEEEIMQIQKIVEECSITNGVLEKKLYNVRKCLGNIGDLTTVEARKTLCFGSASTPSIFQMVEWTEDAWRLYHVLYLKFCNIILKIESQDDKTIAEISKNYLYSDELKGFLERISFMTKKFQEGT